MFVLSANYVVSLVHWWARNGPPCTMFIVLCGYNIYTQIIIPSLDSRGINQKWILILEISPSIMHRKVRGSEFVVIIIMDITCA